MSAIETWEKFLHRSLATRLETEPFSDYVRLLNAKYPLPPWRISDLFLRPMEYNDAALDISIIHYLQVMIGLELVDVPSVLRALWRYSSCRPENEETQIPNGTADNNAAEGEKAEEKEEKPVGNKGKRWKNSWSTEEILFYRLTKHISSGTVPRGAQEAVDLVLICIKWMQAVLAAGQAAHETLLGHTEEMNAQNMALGTLIVSIVESGMVQNVINKGFMAKALRKDFSKNLATFVPFLLQSSPQNAARLEVFRTQTMVAIEPVDKKEAAANKEIDEILDEGMGLGPDNMVIAEIPVVNSRAGLYIYLDSLVSPFVLFDSIRALTEFQLVARPLIDDNLIFAYLHNRYQVRVPERIKGSFTHEQT